VKTVECAHCAGNVRAGANDQFYHQTGHAGTETVAREIRCLLGHEECEPYLKNGLVIHPGEDE
jgi:hypothetical protein